MELLSAVRERRAVREYLDRPVDRSIVSKLIDISVLAPSAMNLQPWVFAVLLGRENVNACGKQAKSWLVANFPQTSFSQTSEGVSLRQMLDDRSYVLFHHAPALVIVLAKSSDSQSAEDCCLAAEILMLAAREEGLGTCWIGLARPWLDLAATKRELALPEQYRVVAPIVLGYPKAWPESHGRNPAEIHWIQ
jgi:nitroreductase